MTPTDSSERVVPRLPESDFGRYFAIGPLRVDDGPCDDCLALWLTDRRRASAHPDSSNCPILFEKLERMLSTFGHRVLAPVRGRVRMFDRLTGELSERRVVTHPACTRCKAEHATGAEHIPGALLEPGILSGRSWRLRPVDAEELEATLVEPAWGPILGLHREEDSEACLIRAPINLPGRGALAAGYGRGSTFEQSKGPALVEAFERMVSASPVFPSTRIVVSNWRELGVNGLDPRRLGVHDPRFSLHPNSLLQPFNPATVTSWVQAWSTLGERSLYVPAHAAYWRTHDGLPKFVYNSSSGTATGGSLAEATLYALFELIERDAFLLMWHARVPLAEVAWRHLPRASALGRSLARRGMTLRVLDATTEFGVAVSVAVIDAEPSTVAVGHNRALNVAAGAHFDQDIATMAAIDEAANNALMYSSWSRRMPGQFDPARFHPMLADFAEVRTLEDHEGLFGLNEARPLWEFLLPKSHPTKRAPRGVLGDAHRDLPKTLAALIDRFHQRQMDVIVVDQSQMRAALSTPLTTVKVIVPELLAMTFGHVHSRIFGSARLQNARQSLLGATGPASFPDQPIPHPFP